MILYPPVDGDVVFIKSCRPWKTLQEDRSHLQAFDGVDEIARVVEDPIVIGGVKLTVALFFTPALAPRPGAPTDAGRLSRPASGASTASPRCAAPAIILSPATRRAERRHAFCAASAPWRATPRSPWWSRAPGGSPVAHHSTPAGAPRRPARPGCSGGLGGPRAPPRAPQPARLPRRARRRRAPGEPSRRSGARARGHLGDDGGPGARDSAAPAAWATRRPALRAALAGQRPTRYSRPPAPDVFGRYRRLPSTGPLQSPCARAPAVLLLLPRGGPVPQSPRASAPGLPGALGPPRPPRTGAASARRAAGPARAAPRRGPRPGRGRCGSVPPRRQTPPPEAPASHGWRAHAPTAPARWRRRQRAAAAAGAPAAGHGARGARGPRRGRAARAGGGGFSGRGRGGGGGADAGGARAGQPR